MSNNRNSENIFLEGSKQVFLCQKKRSRLSCLKEEDRKKNTRKRVKQKRRSNKNSPTKRERKNEKKNFKKIERTKAQMHREKKKQEQQQQGEQTWREDTKRENKLRRKSKENELFLGEFFWTETKGSRQKKQDLFQKRVDNKEKWRSVFWRSCVKNKLTRIFFFKKKTRSFFLQKKK